MFQHNEPRPHARFQERISDLATAARSNTRTIHRCTDKDDCNWKWMNDFHFQATLEEVPKWKHFKDVRSPLPCTTSSHTLQISEILTPWLTHKFKWNCTIINKLRCNESIYVAEKHCSCTPGFGPNFIPWPRILYPGIMDFHTFSCVDLQSSYSSPL